MKRPGWIGVDLDGTLAKYESGQGVAFVGEPIPLMVERVRTWLAEGKQVRIMTARVSRDADPADREAQTLMIRAWCIEHLGQPLLVTCEKDFSMLIRLTPFE